MENPNQILVILLLIYFVAGALLPYLFNRRPKLLLTIGCMAAAGGCLITLWLGIKGLLSPIPIHIIWGNTLPAINLEIFIDRLSGFFLITIAVVALFSSLYSIQYMRVYKEDNLAWWCFCYNTFLLAMVAVIVVKNALIFLIFWEVMTLTSYFLVTFSYRHELVRKAGFIYLVMTHIGTVFIASAFFLLLDGTGGWDFASLAACGSEMHPQMRNIVFICALIGFGTKAGVVPLHIWLPRAHPAAPTNISALMSGIMLKTAIYGIIRILLDILGTGPAWWGGVIIVLGVISAIVGVICALMEHDMKRLLAFHSVENIGIILLGLGACLVLYSWSLPIPAGIALAAALFHVLNHAIFKSLLFLCTGSVYYAAHTKDIEQLGGLIKRMPYTAVLFLIGAIAISAIPPLSGFASEYQIYLSLLAVSYQHVSVLWKLGAIFACTALALTGALAAACFVKAFGISFLALPRTENAATALEVPLGMNLSISPLAVLCIVLGILPGPIINTLTLVADQLTESPQIPSIQVYNLNLALILGGLILVFYGLTKLLAGSKERKSATWGCGIETNAGMEYTAASFSQPIRRVYGSLLRPKRKTNIEYPESAYFNYKISFEEHVGSTFRDYIYSPLRKGVVNIARRWQLIQSGNINWYLGYIFMTLIALLIYVSKG